jgi:hypothetical protein
VHTDTVLKPMTDPPGRTQADPAVHDGHDVIAGSSGVWTQLGQKVMGVLHRVGDILCPDEGLPPTDHDLAWTSLTRREHDSVPPNEVEKLSLSAIEHPRAAGCGGRRA